MINQITIFTPVYNRANLIKDLFHSLCKQKLQNFEWIVIDDNSSDEICEVMNDIIQNSTFKISFSKQIKGGKHRAINKGVQKANTNWFFIVDSDDILTEDATETINDWIEESKNDTSIAAVSGFRKYKNGVLIGDYNSEISKKKYIDCKNTERGIYGLNGDKAEVYRTDILRKYPFKTFDNEFFLTEATVWNLISYEGYKVRWYFYPIYICEYLDDGLTLQGANGLSGYIKNFQGFSYYVKQTLENQKLSGSMRLLIEYLKVVKNKKISIKRAANQLGLSVNKFVLLYFKMPFIKLWKVFIKKC